MSERTITFPNGETRSISLVIDEALGNSYGVSYERYTYWINILRRLGHDSLANKWQVIADEEHADSAA